MLPRPCPEPSALTESRRLQQRSGPDTGRASGGCEPPARGSARYLSAGPRRRRRPAVLGDELIEQQVQFGAAAAGGTLRARLSPQRTQPRQVAAEGAARPHFPRRDSHRRHLPPFRPCRYGNAEHFRGGYGGRGGGTGGAAVAAMAAGGSAGPAGRTVCRSPRLVLSLLSPLHFFFVVVIIYYFRNLLARL